MTTTKTKEPKELAPAEQPATETNTERAISKIAKVLPPACWGQAERLLHIAARHMRRDDNVMRCTPASREQAVIDAAECGLALDGTLAYCVPFGTEATCIVGYRGLIAVAVRSGRLTRVEVDVVHQNDKYIYERVDGKQRLMHAWDIDDDRGEMVGAFAELHHPDGTVSFEIMQKKEIDAVRDRAKSKSGPWKDHYIEMAKKTVIRRALKHYCDDDRLSTAIDMADRDYPAFEQPKGLRQSSLSAN